MRLGNDASRQPQLGTYGDLLTTTALWVRDGHPLDRRSARQLAQAADFLTMIWRRPDPGFWELPAKRHYTHGKIAFWDALHHTVCLAELEHMPARTASRWRSTQDEIRTFVDARCWKREGYVEAPDIDWLDAALLLTSTAFHASDDGRLRATIAAVRGALSARGPLLYRTSRLRSHEGAFVACSFRLVEALARAGSADEARADGRPPGLATDVGPYSEEIDGPRTPSSGTRRRR